MSVFSSGLPLANSTPCRLVGFSSLKGLKGLVVCKLLTPKGVLIAHFTRFSLLGRCPKTPN
ncbi:hypothetical protein [Helicobacter pylori]|uniref:hypothetical protein n=1 Tax=Helicobacter pylori TaxID=210 RepID=UPI00123A61BF|nr:hypothetical protein [Helicobacter pylori]KAA6491873.1 hypothetical protein EPC79_08150 [Helicobacter pylori]